MHTRIFTDEFYIQILHMCIGRMHPRIAVSSGVSALLNSASERASNLQPAFLTSMFSNVTLGQEGVRKRDREKGRETERQRERHTQRGGGGGEYLGALHRLDDHSAINFHIV